MQLKGFFLPGLVCAGLLLQACGGKDSAPVAVDDTVPPTIPAGLVATSQSASSIQLVWQASTDVGSGVVGYRIYRNNGASPVATVASTSYVDTGLAASTTYSYTVSAYDGGANDSGRSTAASATTTMDTTAPTVPSNLSATAQSVSAIQLNWQASTDTESGVAGYLVYRNGNGTPIATVTTTSYLDTGLVAATTYGYTVSAFDGATPRNESNPSPSVNATTASAGGSAVGLDVRPSNTSCLAGDAPSGSVSLGVQRVYPNLNFSNPILMLQEPASSARWFVVQQGGRVLKFNSADASPVATQVIDVSATIAGATGGEMGLLGMAFHPGWPADPRAYLSYTALDSGQLVSRIVEYQTQDGGNTLNAATARNILQVNQPEQNHNGGNIAFGPDGLLYIGIGDGGGGGDGHGTIGNGQRLSTLLGKMLRIDINGTTGSTPYAIPPDNPYRFSSGTTPAAVCNLDTGAWTHNCPEIYAYGFRNPWRWSFDMGGSRELWVGDVGEGAWEEVNRVTLGGNYGWRCFEGDHPYNSTCGPNASSAIRPVAEYTRSQGQAITGGFVYRGSAIPALSGRYVFADYGSQQLWHIARDTAPTLRMSGGLATNLNIVSFGQDHAGEIYMVNSIGTLYRLVNTSGGGGNQVATQLSATGCVSATDATQPASGLIPYSPNAPFWSDGAAKSRWMALPNGQNIMLGADGDFDFPNGTVLVKNFSLNSKLIETRLFMRHNDGNWAGYTYEWNTAGTDATRVVGGKTATREGQSWVYPSEAQCLTCHTAAAGRSLGLERSQLNGLFGYPQTNRIANQLHTLNSLGMLSPALAQPVDQLPAMPDPYGSAGSLNDRARAWLHTNCSQCHRPGGPTSVNMDLRYTTALAATNSCDVAPANALGVVNARRIATQASGASPASRSLVIHRASLTDSNSMPPIQPRRVDAAGVALLSQWMDSLASCG